MIARSLLVTVIALPFVACESGESGEDAATTKSEGQTCIASKCLERNEFDNDCCSATEEASCADGYHYSTGNSCSFTLAYSTCCSKDEKSAAATDEFDWSECDPNECSSPAAFFGTDCYAGSGTEQCTCTGGFSAKETGETTYYEGVTYYEYTCCPPQASSDGESCGDYSDVGALVSIIIGSIFAVVCCCGLFCGGVFFCLAATKKNQVQTPHGNDPGMQPPNGINPYGNNPGVVVGYPAVQPPMYTPPVDNKGDNM